MNKTRNIDIKLYAFLSLFLTIFVLLFTIYSLCFVATYSVLPTPTYVIVLDAGHGGADGGVVAKSGVCESELNLIYAQLLTKRLQSLNIAVVNTRQNKDGLYGELTNGFKLRDMRKRREIIRQANPNLLVSIHMNKFSSSSRCGPQVFFQEKDEVSQKFALTMQKVLNDFTGNAHECLSGEFYILQCVASMPCIIVECGFLSNEREAELLSSPDYQAQLVEAIFNGIMLYLYST
ncbi:MAG: N-acetylmuramoyl-L-alanine amidase [Clostridia bacterium]